MLSKVSERGPSQYCSEIDAATFNIQVQETHFLIVSRLEFDPKSYQTIAYIFQRR